MDFIAQLTALTDKHRKEMGELQDRFAAELLDYQRRHASSFEKQERDFI